MLSSIPPPQISFYFSNTILLLRCVYLSLDGSLLDPSQALGYNGGPYIFILVDAAADVPFLHPLATVGTNPTVSTPAPS